MSRKRSLESFATNRLCVEHPCSGSFSYIQSVAGTACKRSRTETALEGLASVLRLAENVVDGFPIPAAKVVIKGVLKLVDNAKTSCSNRDTLDKLSGHVNALVNLVLEPLSRAREPDIPHELRDQLNTFIKELDTLCHHWIEPRGSRLKQIIHARDDESRLVEFSESVKRAVDRFHMSAQTNGWLSHAAQERLLVQVRDELAEEKKKRECENMNSLVKSLRRAHGASYDSARTRSLESCFPGTRCAVLQKIKKWVVDIDQPNIFWLHGLAGIGKTTIARTVAEWADANGILGASHFFARDVDELRDPRLVFTTLAYQLVRSDENLLESVARAIKDDPDIAHKEIARQFDCLLKGPLQSKRDSTTSWRKLVLVIDALDECENNASATAILGSIVQHVPLLGTNIRVFITSRPEAHIRKIFGRDVEHQSIILHDIEASVVRSDVELYLRDGLSRVHSSLCLVRPDGWPTPEQLRHLLDKSGTLFVHACIALRYIGNERAANPAKRLRMLLSAQTGAILKSHPYAMLDELYLAIFRSAIAEDYDEDDVLRIQNVVGAIVLLRNPLSLGSLAEILQMDTNSVSQTLHHLHSLIIVPPPESPAEPPRFFHPSLPDFITSPDRCSDERFLVDVHVKEAYLCRRCLEILNRGLSYDMAGIGDDCTRRDSVEGLQERVSERFIPSMQYAVKSWAAHLTKSKHTSNDVELIKGLGTFVQEHILHWIEAMSLLGWLHEVEMCLESARGWAIKAGCNSEIADLLHDAMRLFIWNNERIIGQFPLQVYRSALQFLPKHTCLYRAYGSRHSEASLRLLSGSDASPMTTLHHPGALCAAYSQDGNLLAVGGAGYGIDICDPRDPNAYLFNLDQDGEICSLTFAPGCKLLGASCDDRIQLWDIILRSMVRTLSDSSNVNSIEEISFSATQLQPNLAAKRSNAIQFWNSESGELVRTFDFVESVLSFLFFPDGTKFLAAIGASIQVQSVDSGQIIGNFQHTKSIFDVVLSPSSARLAFVDEDDRPFFLDGYSIATQLPVAGPLYQILFSRDDKLIIETLNVSNILSMWDIQYDGAVRLQLAYPDIAFESHINKIVLSPDGGTVLVAYEWGLKTLTYSVELRSEQRSFRCNPSYNTGCLAFSADNSLLATGSPKSGTIQIWDPQTAQILYMLAGDQPSIEALEFSVDGRWLVSSRHVPTPDSQIYTEFTIWDICNRTISRVLAVKEIPDDHELAIPLDGFGMQVIIYCMLSEPPYDLNRRWNTLLSHCDSELGQQKTFRALHWWTWSLQKPIGNIGYRGALMGKSEGANSITPPGNNREKHASLESFGRNGEGVSFLFVDRDQSAYPPFHWLSIGWSQAGRSPAWSCKIALIPTPETIHIAWNGSRCAMACGEDGLLIFDISELQSRFQLELEPVRRADAF